MSKASRSEELNVTHGAVSRQIRLLEDWLGVRLFLRTAGHAVPTPAGEDLLAEAGPALNRLASASLRVRSGAQASGSLCVAALPTFAMRWLIPRLPEFQHDHPALELRIVTASTTAEQFRMDADVVISGPSRQPGWTGKRFLGEARLPLLSPDLMERCPSRVPEDLARHTLLHAATLRGAWPLWLAAADVPDLKPARDQVFEHFYFAIQAAIEGLGVVMGPLALVGDELRGGRLLAPLKEPALRTRGYFVYAPATNGEIPAIAAFRKWLVAAGSFGGDRISQLSLVKSVLTSTARRTTGDDWEARGREMLASMAGLRLGDQAFGDLDRVESGPLQKLISRRNERERTFCSITAVLPCIS